MLDDSHDSHDSFAFLTRHLQCMVKSVRAGSPFEGQSLYDVQSNRLNVVRPYLKQLHLKEKLFFAVLTTAYVTEKHLMSQRSR